ncbi:MAG: 16S rRNA (guanine(527)-N(7))-methyltransferase RsmG [Tissierellia bacterium]|nr:16S rRNA (guanine(527)-N(7))-methyltransferase RsmG [Tissierellia bacterium]
MQNNLFEKYQVAVNEEQQAQFEKYREMILEYNKIMDITNITEYDQMYIKHFIDSIYVDKTSIDFNSKKIIDIGTGGGFPGIPIKFIYTESKITLMDSLNKRIKFLQDVIEQMDLKDIEALHARAEELARDNDYREKYDIAISRAVAELRTLIEYSLGFVKVGGYFIAMKGPNFQEELDNATNSIKEMGGKLEKTITYSLPDDNGERSLLLIKKVKPTPPKYPRGQGKPRSKPL